MLDWASRGSCHCATALPFDQTIHDAMPQPRHLNNAPITEALIDFRVKARPDLNVKDFAVVGPQVDHLLPKMEEKRGMEAMIEFRAGESQARTKDLGLMGYFFKSSDEKHIAQFRTDGFTFNRLRPYTSWDEVFPLAMDFWRVYWNVARPEVVTRLAVRYINSVPLPQPVEDFDDYLRAAPPIPPELPQFMGGFLSRITIHDPDTDISANVAQALEQNVDAGTQTVIVDIDAFRHVDYSPDDPGIVETFAQLRKFKNDVFFNILTEEMLRHFE